MKGRIGFQARSARVASVALVVAWLLAGASAAHATLPTHLGVVVESVGSLFRYTYTLENDAASDELVNLFQLDVPDNADPLVGMALIPEARADAFNRQAPANDAAFKADAVARILTFNGNNLAHAQSVANTLFPDVLTLDVTSNAGFVTGPLNGRRWDDDFVDIALTIFTNGRRHHRQRTGERRAVLVRLPVLRAGASAFRPGRRLRRSTYLRAHWTHVPASMGR